MYTGISWVVFVLLHILEKQSQAFVREGYVCVREREKERVSVCLVATDAFFSPSACLEGTYYVPVHMLSILNFNHSRRIFPTTIHKWDWSVDSPFGEHRHDQILIIITE